MLSGREYHRQLSLFNPYSVLFLITHASDGYCKFRVTLGISLTIPNKKSFFDFLPLKIFTSHNIENSSEKS